MKTLIKILCLSMLWFSCESPTEPVISCPDNSISGPDYWNNDNYCYSNEDIEVLQNFIDNSIETLNVEIMDWYNNDGLVQWYELGWQEWNQGRLVKFSTYFLPYNSQISYNCNLSGEIPTSISNWTEITYLYLGYHPISTVPSQTLTGNIPYEISALTKLKNLYLHSNSFTGELPDIFEDLTNLETLWLDNNELDGSLPESLWSLVNIRELYLEHNQFYGNLSSNIESLVNLEHFWINHNSISGVLPEEIFTLNKLIKLKINNNSFEGNISNNIENLSALEVVDFSFNNFEGFIPENICNLNINFEGSWSDLYYLYDINNFDVTNNNLCPNLNFEYPVCIENYIGTQNIEDCYGRSYNFIPNSKRISTKKNIK